MAGYQIAGDRGAMAGIVHTLLDTASDSIVKESSTKTRDLMEAVFNYLT